ncbi:MAG TPA: hypothetical protein DC047_15325 [Blastocatellia bacterium]|nr:hypothetical protein [Blastocatellia bacterium]
MDNRDSKSDRERIEERNWEPAAASAKDEVRNDERSLDVGESGQFAPGGYYNQQGVNAPDRSALDADNKSDKF